MTSFRTYAGRTLMLAALLLFPQLLFGAGARLFKSGPVQVTADGSFVWVSNQDNDSVSRITTADDSVLELILPEPGTRDSPARCSSAGGERVPTRSTSCTRCCRGSHCAIPCGRDCSPYRRSSFAKATIVNGS